MNQDIKFKKPYYSVYANYGSAGEIWVNDVPIMKWMGEQTEDGNFSGDLPINHVVLENGKFIITCKLLPNHGKKNLFDGNSFILHFFCTEADDLRIKMQTRPPFESPEPVRSKENFNKFINPVYEGLPKYEMSSELEITELPFVLDGWQKSINLLEEFKNKKDQLIQKTINCYRQIHTFLSNHDANGFLEFSKEKEELQSKAFYFDEDRKNSFRNSAISLFGQNLEVEPLREKEFIPQIMGYGKLIRLIYSDGSQPIQFKSPKPEEQSNIEFDIKLHMKNLTKGFSII